jgi:catecholate siderophore receptor
MRSVSSAFWRGMVPLLVSLLFLAFPAKAQQKSHLMVKVVDPGGLAVAGAEIEVADGKSESAASGLSDGEGGFGADVLTGKCRISVSHAGFKAMIQDVETFPGQTLKLTFALPLLDAVQTVEVHTDEYKADVATSGTRVPMSVLETPQQVQVLTSELMRDRGAGNMKQAVEIVPSVGLQLGEGRRDNFFIRGFNAVGDMYIDGVRDSAQYYRDLSNTERIEVLEGPAAVLYGRGSSGGLINRVTKKPSMEGTLGEITYTFGNYDEPQGTADLDTVVPHTGRKLGFRLTGAAEHEHSHRDFYWEDRYTFAPTLLWKPDDATTISAQVERLRDDRLPDRGIPYLPATGLPAPVPVGNFYGYVGPKAGSNFIHSAVTDGTLDVRHEFADGWVVHAVQRLAGYTTNFANMYATAVTPVAGGDYAVARGEYNGTQNWTTADTTVEAYRSGRLLGMRHTMLAGFEYAREVTDSTQFNGPTNQTPVSLLHPVPTAPILSSVLSRNNRFLGQTGAIYVQDQVKFAAKWQALLGVRVDDFRQTLELRPPTNATSNLARTDYAASPRVGVVYQARPWASLYGNYSRTFDPSGENLSLAVNNAQLEPEVTQNYEAGAKANLLQDRLLATASVFRLDRTNIKTTDPNNPLALLNLGEQRTDGAEVNLQGAIARRWQVYAGYAWLDGRIVSSTTLSNGVLLQGKRPAMSALHSASLWTSYSFAGGFGFAGGLVSRAKQFAATDNLALLPAYARVDASVFWRRARYAVQANVQNVGDVKYYDAAQSDYQIYPAAPINASVTATWRF